MNSDNENIEILYREKNFAAVIKPASVISESPSGSKDKSMVSLLKNQLGTEVYPVHRLDRETSGVMIYALSAVGAAKLSALVSNGGLTKIYLAVVQGKPESNSGTMEDLLFKDSAKNKSYVVKRMRAGVKKASLEYSVLGTRETCGKALSLVRVKLHTGRTHQIRVQFASRGMSVFGDKKYGGEGNELALFSESISFTNPFSKKAVCVSALPDGELFSMFADLLGQS